MQGARTTRRGLLAAGLAGSVVATAGCTGLLDTGDEEGDGGSRLRLTLSRVEGPLRDRYVQDLSERNPPWSQEAFAATVAGERYTTQGRKPFYSTPADPTYARRDGTYYLLGSVVVDEVATTHPILRLYEADDGDGEAAVAADTLPEADQRAVKIAHMAARARGNEGGVPWGLVVRGGYAYRREEAVEASRLLADDGPTHVTFRDTRYRVAVSRERFHESVYRATAEPVAESPERMESILRGKFVEARFGREDLSADAREILREAEADEYVESHPYSEAYRAVLRALHARAYIDGNVRKDALSADLREEYVIYDGTYFTHHLSLLDGD